MGQQAFVINRGDAQELVSSHSTAGQNPLSCRPDCGVLFGHWSSMDGRPSRESVCVAAAPSKRRAEPIGASWTGSRTKMRVAKCGPTLRNDEPVLAPTSSRDLQLFRFRGLGKRHVSASCLQNETALCKTASLVWAGRGLTCQAPTLCTKQILSVILLSRASVHSDFGISQPHT